MKVGISIIGQNSHERKLLKGQRCKIIKIGKMNSALVRFENGMEAIISRRALRKEKQDE